MQNVKAVKHYEDARAYYKNGKYPDAERSYRKAIKINPDYADAHNDLGNLYMKTGRLKESFNAYRKALKAAPNHSKLLSNIGNVLMMQSEFEKALGWLEKAILHDPENALSHCNLGSTLRGLGEHLKAAIAYRRAIELNPKLALFHQNLGGVLIELGALDEAIDCFKQVLNINPEDQAAYIGLGKAHNKQGDLDQSVSAYEKAISLDPTNAKCFSGLGQTFDDHGEAEKAVVALKKALEINPDLISCYPVLVRNKKFTEIDADIRAMESLYLAKGKTDIQRSCLAYSLGKAYEDLDEYNRSIELVIEAARLKRKTFDYSPSATCVKFDRIKEVFSPDFFAKHPDSGHCDPAPIFILGLPRSGTSLVEQILASHPAVFGAGELKDLASVYQSINTGQESPQSDKFPEDLIGLSPEVFENLGRQYISKIRSYSPTSTFVTDKFPHNFQRIGFIRAILPQARNYPLYSGSNGQLPVTL